MLYIKDVDFLAVIIQLMFLPVFAVSIICTILSLQMFSAGPIIVFPSYPCFGPLTKTVIYYSPCVYQIS
jgi:hypothetical protein